jgi:dTDP-4-dehydrorhamnose reductase
MPNFVILGNRGVLASTIIRNLSHSAENSITGLGKHELDITNFKEVDQYVATLSTATIINCAAFMPADRCETEVEKSKLINLEAVHNLAKSVASNPRVRLINFSSDFVFSGDKNNPYNDIEMPDPISVYGRHKAAADSLLMEILPKRGRTLRIASLVAYSDTKKTFIEKILSNARKFGKISVVENLAISVTTEDLVQKVLPNVFESDEPIVNAVHRGSSSWYALATLAVKIFEPLTEISPVPASAFPTIAPRPKYSVLKPSSVVEALDNRHWEEAVQFYLTSNQENFK